MPYVCLRLPDVIGPYDNTNRFWSTIKWLQESEKWNVPICSED
jgi:nucleoside-diphosphate-sugar epimerase